MLNRATTWLETKWVTPAYGGWLLGLLTICFFGAATNTMAGWLYVLSGIGVALLSVGAILPPRSLQALTVDRQPILPVTAGADLEIALTIHNSTSQVQTLFQVRDLTSFSGSNLPIVAIEQISPQNHYKWIYRQPTAQRGLYQWGKVALLNGAPLGLFWCRRERLAPAIAYVYPPALKLDRCPLIDGMGSPDRQNRQFADRRLEAASEGVTRSLRPYRYGDPMRSIHWRTSARYGNFQVRELEIDRGGQDLAIYLDSSADWDAADFEQAVIAACTLYFYANARLDVQLWTASTGLIAGTRQVLETLAAVQPNESIASELPAIPVVCLTNRSTQPSTLAPGSRWLLWSADRANDPTGTTGITIDPSQSLQQQLGSQDLASNRLASIGRSPFTQNSDLN
ncbi:DUF58 domain-containing protein [Chamaesiphon sp. VAR_69_metabat_338]|uniref:DUF58 domain-containing protein n=1 Tax=Chamaesiphon sp. VAR_69_metabat_338 TaxID=2964704 RepID=UPI00286D9F9E|nr:DUF58 domain-containing protein [Chamaesiphon sp. VAR_69_metabat_338]